MYVWSTSYDISCLYWTVYWEPTMCEMWMYDIYSEPLRKPNLVYIYICVYVCVCEYGGLVAKLCPTLVAPWTVAFQAPLSLGFSRQEYWSGLPFSSPGDLPNPGIKSNPVFCIAGRFFTNWATREAIYIYVCVCVCVYHLYIYNIRSSFNLMLQSYLFFWLIIKAGINLYLLEGAPYSRNVCSFGTFVILPLGFHSQTDKIGFWAAPGVPVSHCPCFVAVNWALQPQYWCSTAGPLLQTVWSFRGGKRSPVSLSLPFSGLHSSFISQATISQECCLHTDLDPVYTQSHSYSCPRDQTGSIGSLSDYFLI